MFSRFVMAAVCLSIGVCAGCATSGGPEGAEAINGAQTPLYSIDSSGGMEVAISPAGRALRIGGTYGSILGAGIDAIANDRHRKALADVLEGWEPGKAFDAYLAARIDEALGANARRVNPLGSTAGYANVRDAVLARYEQLAREGGDTVLELDLAYGLYGYQGTLVTTIDAEVRDLPSGSRQWHQEFFVSTDPVLGTDKLEKPTAQLKPSFEGGFRASEDAINQWTGDGGAIIRERFDEAVRGVTSALLVALDLADEAPGHYYLGKMDVMRKNFEKAEAHFERALALDGSLMAAQNGLIVAYGHDNRVDEARRLAETVTAAHPDYGPAWMNLAWVEAVKAENPTAARAPYERALALGMAPQRDIEKQLES